MMLPALLVAAVAAGQPLSGVVFCQHPEKPVEVRVFSGTRAPWGLTPQGPPLITTQTPCGQRFAFHVPDPPPWRVEVVVPGHVAATYHLAEPSPLPPVWLPRAPSRTVEMGGSWRGTLQVWGSLAEARPWGRWVPALPTTRLLRPGKVAFFAPKDASFSVWGQDEGGAFARWEVTGEGRALRFAPSWATVRVVDERGRPVAGAWVVAEGAPAGAEVLTDAQGTARVPVPPGRGEVAAWKEGLGAALASLPAREPLTLQLRPARALRLVRAQPYPGLQVVPRPWVSGLAGGWATSDQRVLRFGRGLELGLWAPGFAFQRAVVEGESDSVGIRLVPEGQLRLRVVDPHGKPVSGAAVFVDETQPLGPWGSGPVVPSLLARGVTDAQGTLLVGADPGPVTVRVVAPPWAEAREEVEVLPGQSTEKTVTLALGAGLRLQVADPQGRPLSGVTAEVTRQGLDAVRYGGFPQHPLLVAASDREGRLTLAPLAPGSVRIHLAKEGFVTRNLDLELPPEGKDLGTVTLEPGVPLQGRVVNERGEGIPQAKIYAGSDEAMLFEEAGETDKDGFFTLADRPRAGLLYLRAERQNGASSSLLKVELPSPPVQLVIPTGQAIVGRVVRAADGRPVAGARVSVAEVRTRRVAGFSAMSVRSLGAGVETGEDGGFRLEVGNGTSFELRVRAKGFREAVRDVRLSPEEEPRPLLISLDEGLVLAGKVTEPTGRPAVGVEVRAESFREIADSAFTARIGRVWSTVTDGDGGFRFQDLPAGRYQVIARTPEGFRARELAEAGKEDLELQLEAPGTLTVVVREAEGAPVAGASVEVHDPADQRLSQTTDAQGEVRIGQATPGVHSVAVIHPSFPTAWRQAEVKAGQEAKLEVTLEPGGVVEGVVKGLSAHELSQCSVRVGWNSAKPLPDGSFRLTKAPLGKRRVEARIGWTGRFRRAEVEVKSDAPAWVELDFAAGLTLSGQVHKQGRPLSGLFVAANRQDEGVADHTDEQGQFRLRGLEAGTWTLSIADASGQVLHRQEVELKADRHLEVALPAGELAGRVVVAGTREPVVEAAVTVSQGGSYLRQETTGEDGRFLFADLPDGDFTVSAQAPGYGRASREVHLASGQAPEVELALPREAVLELFVQEMTGGAPERVWVRLADAAGQTQQLSVPLDRRGRGVVPGLPPGTYGMVVHGFGSAAAVVTTPGQARVILQPPGELLLKAPAERDARARVFFPEGLPVPLGWQADAGGEVTVQAGQARSLSLPPGRYRLVSGSGGVAEADVTADRPAVVELP